MLSVQGSTPGKSDRIQNLWDSVSSLNILYAFLGVREKNCHSSSSITESELLAFPQYAFLAKS